VTHVPGSAAVVVVVGSDVVVVGSDVVVVGCVVVVVGSAVVAVVVVGSVPPSPTVFPPPHIQQAMVASTPVVGLAHPAAPEHPLASYHSHPSLKESTQFDGSVTHVPGSGVVVVVVGVVGGEPFPISAT